MLKKRFVTPLPFFNTFDHAFIGSRPVESWDLVKSLITPGNLMHLGNPNYSTLASCLGLLTPYNNGPAKVAENETKVGLRRFS